MANESLIVGNSNWAVKANNLLGYAVGETSGYYVPRELDFTRNSTATYTDENGIIQTAAANIARVQDNALLLEPQRTNLITFSEQIDNAAWTKQNTTTISNQDIAPDGTMTADLLYPNSTGTFRAVRRSVSVSGVQTYSFSFFAKASGFQWLRIRSIEDSAIYANFDVLNGVVGVVQSGLIASITPFQNGWFSCVVIGNSTSTIASCYINLSDNDGTGAPTATANDTDGIYIWGAQLEVGSYATSYIPTTSATVTRLADSCSKTGISSLIGQTEGVFYLNLNREGVSGIANAPLINISDGSNNNRLRILSTTFVSLRILFQLNGNVVQYDTSTTPDFVNAIDQQIKIAVAYKSGDIAVYINGQLLNASSNTLTFSAPLTDYRLDNGENGLIVSEALLFPTRLSNTELQSLTTL